MLQKTHFYVRVLNTTKKLTSSLRTWDNIFKQCNDYESSSSSSCDDDDLVMAKFKYYIKIISHTLNNLIRKLNSNEGKIKHLLSK